jgi:hypothetical protein
MLQKQSGLLFDIGEVMFNSGIAIFEQLLDFLLEIQVPDVLWQLNFH